MNLEIEKKYEMTTQNESRIVENGQLIGISDIERYYIINLDYLEVRITKEHFFIKDARSCDYIQRTVTVKVGNGDVRSEIYNNISKKEYEELKKMAISHIGKKSYVYRLNEHIFELDYLRENKLGLSGVIEVEFDSIEEMNNFDTERYFLSNEVKTKTKDFSLDI